MIYNYVDICIYYDHYDMICYSWRLCFTHRLMAALSYTLQQNWLRTEKKAATGGCSISMLVYWMVYHCYKLVPPTYKLVYNPI